jgi:hypothetical protein
MQYFRPGGPSMANGISQLQLTECFHVYLIALGHSKPLQRRKQP